MTSREEVIGLLSDLVGFDTTINPEQNVFPAADCAEYIKEYANQTGYNILPVTCSYKNNPAFPIFPVLIYKQGKNPGPTVLYLGHIDVVPVSKAEIPDWKHEPFNPVVEGNLLYGRGSGDMKGGVAAQLLAFKDLEIERGNVVIALSGDEEIGGTDSVPAMIDELRKHQLLPNYVINAEGAGEQVIVTKRRGGTQVSFSFDLDYATTEGELKSRKFHSSHGDGSESLHSMSFILGADVHAMIAAGKFSMEKPIVKVHSSSIKSNSAPKTVQIDYVDTTQKTGKLRYSKGLTGVMNALASIGSLDWPIVPSKYGPSVCPNLLELDEKSKNGKITFDIRSMLEGPESHEILIQNIQEHFLNYGVEAEFEIQLAIDPVNVSPEHPLAQKAKRIAEEEGWQITTVGEKLGGASDTRFFTSLDIPGIEIGPVSHNGHGMNEHVEIDSVVSLTKLNQRLFKELTTPE